MTAGELCCMFYSVPFPDNLLVWLAIDILSTLQDSVQLYWEFVGSQNGWIVDPAG